MSESLGWCVEAVRAAEEPALSRALLALRGRHTRRAGGPARIRERGGLGPLLELVGPEKPRRILELALSVIGNCCTERGCRRQARSLGGIPRLVSVLALTSAPESVRNRAARALANLALEPDGARDVLEAGAAPLLISLTSTCSTPGCLLSAARALRILGAPQNQRERPQNQRERPQNQREQPQNQRERPQNQRERPQNQRERPQNQRERPQNRPPLSPQSRLQAAQALAGRLAALDRADPSCPALARALRGLLAVTPCPVAVAEAVRPALRVLAALAAQERPRWPEGRGAALDTLAMVSARGWLRPELGAAGAVEAAVAAIG
ncbi:PREDICTED: armadillo repeat-containing protein 5 [Pseudopodoces humilis]|uniref:armadillo repeat-containing protein 5 n=1 Tax=Pseudopodoces humilis TaxID=181119 RepID=UPI0006B7D75D|nr:PREDICTED: armadillo repeat-containing protein 5 [Pseudopodoces humilis]